MRGKDRGFTLLEVLIAFAITAIAVAALIKAVSFGLEAAHQSGRYQEALSRARSHLAALATDIDRLGGVHDGDDGGGYRWQIEVRPFTPPGGEAQPMGPATPMLYAVTVTISWAERGHTRSVRLDSELLGQQPQ
jgi:general secretion pathway protein I